jgi:thymidylate kinase
MGRLMSDTKYTYFPPQAENLPPSEARPQRVRKGGKRGKRRQQHVILRKYTKSKTALQGNKQQQ